MEYQIYNEDCIKGMKKIPDKSVNAVIADLPFGITNCKWDSVIDFDKLWQELHRVLKPYSAVVLFSSGRFTHQLIASNFAEFKYKWIWLKANPTMFVHAKNAPMRRYEEICIFSDGSIAHAGQKRRMTYNPQGVVACEFLKPNDNKFSPTQVKTSGWTHLKKPRDKSSVYGARPSRGGVKVDNNAKAKFSNVYAPRPSHTDSYVQEFTGYPDDVLEFKPPPTFGRFHPNEKPVNILEFLVKTYSNFGETVLDVTMGSGSTGVACANTGRKFIGFETDPKYFEIAYTRINKAIENREQSLFFEELAT